MTCLNNVHFLYHYAGTSKTYKWFINPHIIIIKDFHLIKYRMKKDGVIIFVYKCILLQAKI